MIGYLLRAARLVRLGVVDVVLGVLDLLADLGRVRRPELPLRRAPSVLADCTSAKPPRKMRSALPPRVTVTTPGRGEHRRMTGRMSPSVPGISTASTSSDISRLRAHKFERKLPLIVSCSRPLRPLGLFDRFFDGADHVEGGFRQMVIGAVAQLEALDRICERNQLAGRAGEHFGDEEGL